MSIIKRYFLGEAITKEQEFIKSAIAGDVRRAEALITEQNSVVNFQDESSGLTGLMIFVADGNRSMAETICAVPNIDLTLEDSEGRTASWLANCIGREDISSVIMNRMVADINALDAAENTVQKTASSSEQDRSGAKIVELNSWKKPRGPTI